MIQKFCPHCSSILVPGNNDGYLYCLKCFKYKEKISDKAQTKENQ